MTSQLVNELNPDEGGRVETQSPGQKDLLQFYICILGFPLLPGLSLPCLYSRSVNMEISLFCFQSTCKSTLNKNQCVILFASFFDCSVFDFSEGSLGLYLLLVGKR